MLLSRDKDVAKRDRHDRVKETSSDMRMKKTFTD